MKQGLRKKRKLPGTAPAQRTGPAFEGTQAQRAQYRQNNPAPQPQGQNQGSNTRQKFGIIAQGRQARGEQNMQAQKFAMGQQNMQAQSGVMPGRQAMNPTGKGGQLGMLAQKFAMGQAKKKKLGQQNMQAQQNFGQRAFSQMQQLQGRQGGGMAGGSRFQQPANLQGRQIGGDFTQPMTGRSRRRTNYME
jgi:hypothetical protein